MSAFITLDCNDRDTSFSVIRDTSFNIGFDELGNIVIEDYNTGIKSLSDLRLHTIIVSFMIPDIDVEDVLVFLPKHYTLPDAYSKIREYLNKTNYINIEEIEEKYIEEISSYCVIYPISLSLEEYCKAFNSKDIIIRNTKTRIFI